VTAIGRRLVAEIARHAEIQRFGKRLQRRPEAARSARHGDK
jgi:hypothetical protein